MIPSIIRSRLRQLRTRERMLQLVWGLVRWLCLVAVVLGFGLLVDWVWDRYQDVPKLVHQILLGLTCGAAFLGFVGFVLVPLLTRIHDDTLALWIEERFPEFRDRLISAVQLNRKGADTQGMSPALIAVVTREAETRAEAQSFAHVADHGRVGWAFKLLVPVALLAALPIVLAPVTTRILLARHLLKDREIPRDIRLELAKENQIEPAGEKVLVTFRVHAPNIAPDALKDMVGDVWVTPKGMPRDRYPLEFLDMEKDTPIFAAHVAAGTVDFKYTARLGDGRLKKAGHVTLVPRPSVEDMVAWTILPAYVGTEGGQRFEVDQPRGDIIGIPGSAAKVQITTARPIARGRLELLAPKPMPAPADGVKVDDAKPDGAKPAESAPGDAKALPKAAEILPSAEPIEEEKTREIPLVIGADKKTATARFDLDPKETGYRVVLFDENEFQNIPPPRRSVRVVAEEPPTVALLKDYFAPGSVGEKEQLEDFNIDGIPVPAGETIRVPYVAEGPYGLGQAWFLYRVIHPTESGNEQPEEEPFKRLPLSQVKATDKTGKYDQRRGVFKNTPQDKSVDFYVQPSDESPGRMLGGGRVHFKTSGIADGKGGTIELKEGDKIEYCIEVHADSGKHPGRPVVRTETRVATIGTLESLIRWASDYAQEAQRLGELNRKQRGIFGQR